GKIRGDHAQPFGFHVEADELAVFRIEPNGNPPPSATIPAHLLFKQQSLVDHLVDQIADSRIADAQSAGEIDAAGGALAVQRLQQHVSLCAFGPRGDCVFRPEHEDVTLVLGKSLKSYKRKS